MRVPSAVLYTRQLHPGIETVYQCTWRALAFRLGGGRDRCEKVGPLGYVRCAKKMTARNRLTELVVFVTVVNPVTALQYQSMRSENVVGISDLLVDVSCTWLS